jgi:hypothetical protein
MRRGLATTVVCLVDEPGTERVERLERLGEAANVRVIQPDHAAAPLDRAVETWRAATGTHLPFTVTDADPLAVVHAAWTHRFDLEAPDGPAPAGELEVAINETLLRWRAGSLELPDFYLLTATDELPPLDRHWYLGVVASACARRVVLAGGSLLMSLRRLPAGPWWPALDDVLAGVERALPEDVRLPSPERTPPQLQIPEGNRLLR